MISTGSVAIFLRELEVGPTALIVIGAVLIIMAVTGSPVTKAKFGENEVTLARRQAIEVIEATPLSDRPAAIAVMNTYDPSAAASLYASYLKGINRSGPWREELAKELVAMFPGKLKKSGTYSTADYIFTRAGESFGIMPCRGEVFTHTGLARNFAKAHQLVHKKVFLIVPHELPDHVIDSWLNRDEKVILVTWRDAQDNENLKFHIAQNVASRKK